MNDLSLRERLSVTMVSIYRDLIEVFEELAISYVVVGATARDLVLVNCFGSTMERGTRDVDFAICVETWDDFNLVKDNLENYAFEADKNLCYRFSRTGDDGLTWEIDLLPYGGVEDAKQIAWPPTHAFIMSTYGFEEAARSAYQVEIAEDLILPVASVEAMALLKLVAWTERETNKEKDAQDFEYIIQNYSHIPEVVNRLYEESYMEGAEYDINVASAQLLGENCMVLANEETSDYLNEALFQNEKQSRLFTSDMKKHSKYPNECAKIFHQFKANFQ